MATIADFLKFIGLNCPTYKQVYPVGSIYMSVNGTDPGTLFGGTWTQIQGRFLVACGDNGASGNAALSLSNGATGGERVHALSAGETGIRNHGHAFTVPTVDGGGGAAITGGPHSHSAGDKKAFIRYNHDVVGSGVGERSVASGASGNYKAPVVNDSKVDFSYAENTASQTHSHSLPDHRHRVTGGAVNNPTGGEKAGAAHENLPPYLAVYIWQRTA